MYYSTGNNYWTLEHSPLEALVSEYSVQNTDLPWYQFNPPIGYYDSPPVAPMHFLSRKRPALNIISSAIEIMDIIREVFIATTGELLPDEFTFKISNRGELIKDNFAFVNPQVVGLSLHATKKVFVVSSALDEVLLIAGHEIGHIRRPLVNEVGKEEAKAFAFESAWARAIYENNIAGLAQSINASKFLPAKNAIHNIAHSFVDSSGIDPLRLFNSISLVPKVQHEATVYLPAALQSVSEKPLIKYGGYLNKSRVQNLPPPHNFFWSNLGKGIYGMYIPLTQVETLNEGLLRQDIEQMHKTMGHEYSLHHVMQLPDGYVVKALEQAMFWTAEEEKYGSARPHKSNY